MPTTMETCEPGFVLWCPAFGAADGRGTPLGLAYQLDPADPMSDAEAIAESEQVWGYLHKVAAPGDSIAICRIPESDEDVAAGKPRCFAGLDLKKGSAEVKAAAVKLAEVGTVRWDGRTAHKL